MSKVLTREHVASFHYNGFLYPIPALSPDDIAICLAGLERLESELGAPVADADIKWRSHAYTHSPWISNDLVRHPRCSRRASRTSSAPTSWCGRAPSSSREPRSQTFAAWHPGRRVFRPGAARAGLRLGRAYDRRQPRSRLHGDAVEQGRAAPAAPRGNGAGEQHQLRAGQTIVSSRSTSAAS